MHTHAQCCNNIGFFTAERRHRVKSGETLASIALAHYGNESHWLEIFEMNREIILDVNHPTPNTHLIMPHLQHAATPVTLVL